MITYEHQYCIDRAKDAIDAYEIDKDATYLQAARRWLHEAELAFFSEGIDLHNAEMERDDLRDQLQAVTQAKPRDPDEAELTDIHNWLDGDMEITGDYSTEFNDPRAAMLQEAASARNHEAVDAARPV